MGGGSPKQAEYQPGETEKTQAAIAQADQQYFEQTYDPLLVEMRDKSRSDDASRLLRGRAQADTMQTLTGPGTLNPNISTNFDQAANIASGAVGNILSANVTAKNVKDKERLNVLGIARGQAADAGSALAQASRLESSQRLADAKANLQVRMANRAMLAAPVLSAGRTYGRLRLADMNKNPMVDNSKRNEVSG